MLKMLLHELETKMQYKINALKRTNTIRIWPQEKISPNRVMRPQSVKKGPLAVVVYIIFQMKKHLHGYVYCRFLRLT